MELGDAIRARRMVRRTSGAPVDQSVVLGLLDAARRAPSAGFSQGVDVVVVTSPRTRRAIAVASGEDGYVRRGLEPWLSVAPVHVVVCADERAYRARYAEPDKRGGPDDWAVPYWFVDAGALLQNLLLLATEAGLAAAFLGAHAVPGLDALLGVPADVHPLGVLTLGWPHDEPPPPVGSAARRPRRSLTDQVHLERW